VTAIISGSRVLSAANQINFSDLLFIWITQEGTAGRILFPPYSNMSRVP